MTRIFAPQHHDPRDTHLFLIYSITAGAQMTSVKSTRQKCYIVVLQVCFTDCQLCLCLMPVRHRSRWDRAGALKATVLRVLLKLDLTENHFTAHRSSQIPIEYVGNE
jgi:hypothetical protein